jgi:hypothetical protein
VGWFADPTPETADEFQPVGSGRYRALANRAAADRVDLLTVVAHELGHLLQHGHSQVEGQLMAESLPAGERRLAIELEPIAVEHLFDELFGGQDQS